MTRTRYELDADKKHCQVLDALVSQLKDAVMSVELSGHDAVFNMMLNKLVPVYEEIITQIRLTPGEEKFLKDAESHLLKG